MNTPICDFVKRYCESDTLRLHMPGHKGVKRLGFEHLDITEIKGADSLFEADSIIKESEENAGTLFGAHTFYSTEGSSLSIRAMLYLSLLYAKKFGKEKLILAGRNAHKAFLSAIALLDMDAEWLYDEKGSYLSCDISAQQLDNTLSKMKKKPVAVYVTSPDYLGNTVDIKGLSAVCKKHDVLLLVDNAHGAYLKFLEKSEHPIDFGADMCCDSAHKTLPVLTGGAYLHISKTAEQMFKENAKKAMSLFASTSPSYLILQSLDMCNNILSESYAHSISRFAKEVQSLKESLNELGYTIVGDESLKITVATKAYGYLGNDFAEILRKHRIECEFSDADFVVLMLSPGKDFDALSCIKRVFSLIEKREAIVTSPPKISMPEKAMSVREAMLSNSKTVNVKDSVGKVLASVSVSCPPAVPIVVSGEKIDENALECFLYYGIKECDVVAE